MKKNTLLFLFFLFCNLHQSSAQGWVWGRDGKINSNGIEEGGPLSIDKQGNIYGINLVGSLLYTPGLLTSQYGPFSISDSLDYIQYVVYSLDDSGHFRWATGTYGGLQLNSIGSDDDGNVYINGYKTFAPGFFAGLYFPDTLYRNFIVKLNTAGTGVWAKMLPAGITINNIAVSHTGDIFFTGYFKTSPITFGSSTITSNHDNDVIAGKYDSAGNQLWAIAFGGDTADYGNNIAPGPNGGLYLSGSSYSTSLIIGHDSLYNPSGPGKQFLFVCRIDSNKNLLWGKSIIPSIDGGGITGLAKGPKEDLYCSGGYNNSIYSGTDTLPPGPGPGRMFLFRFDSSGLLKWGRTINDYALFAASSMDVDDCGNIWVSGEGGHLADPISDQMYLARFDTSGNLKDTLFLKSGGDDSNWIKLDKKGYLYVSGDYMRNPFIFGDDTLDNSGTQEFLFVGKYIYALPECVLDTVTYHHIKTGITSIGDNTLSISIFPNPANDEVTIHSDIPFPSDSKVEIFDLSGRLIYTYSLSGRETEITLTKYPAGMYQCRIIVGCNPVVTKKIIVLK